MSRTITYGIGGYDESKPDNNIVQITDIPDEEQQNEESIDPSSRSILSRLVGK
jgi:hypothetical protein